MIAELTSFQIAFFIGAIRNIMLGIKPIILHLEEFSRSNGFVLESGNVTKNTVTRYSVN